MSTSKRQRQKAGRQARLEAARAAQKRAKRNRGIRNVAVAAVALIIGALLFAQLGGGDDKTDVGAEGTTTLPTQPTTSSTLPVQSAAGLPCVTRTEELPAGAPDVPVQVGPPPTTLVIEDLVEGTGDVVPAGATISVNYIGVSCSSGVVFDDSYSRGQPATFALSGVIKGWTDGIPGMKVGGRRLLGIPSDQAYGPDAMSHAGHPPRRSPVVRRRGHRDSVIPWGCAPHPSPPGELALAPSALKRSLRSASAGGLTGPRSRNHRLALAAGRGQGERERGAAAGRGHDPDPPAHALRRPAGDVEAEADALLGAGQVVAEAGELVEDALAVAGCDAGALVDHGGHHRDALPLDHHPHRRALG